MKDKQNTSLPGSFSPADLRETVLKLIASSGKPLTRSQIARHLSIRGDRRLDLKQVLNSLEEEGRLGRGQRRRVTGAGNIPVTGREPGRQPANLSQHHLGIFSSSRSGGGRLSSCHRKDKFPGVRLTPAESAGLQDGDIVAYEIGSKGRAGERAGGFGEGYLGGRLLIHKKIGRIDDPATFSQMAIYAHGLPHVFSKEALALSEKAKIPPLQEGAFIREDLRHLPLVTIDGEDARDFDDAVWAASDDDPRNSGGWKIVVAIADVAYYVREGDALDREAAERGNSVYFPDQVVPMLPEALSNGLCSLKPEVDRACMTIEMVLSADGKVKSHRLKRGLMRSIARLTYTQVQKAVDGLPDEATAPLLVPVIQPLYGAYRSLLKARLQRGTLDLDQPENQVIFGTDGHITQVVPRPRYDSHRVIEEFMIAANVAAARMLATKGWPCLYRIHDAPDPVRVANLRQALAKMKISFTRAANPQPAQFNDLLKAVRETPVSQMISDLVLRSQAQARYSPANIGHFGLSLAQYAHFTSPIRRYADLVVHRGLISALDLGNDGLPDKSVNLTAIGDHISATERAAAVAEREVMERFITAFHAPHVGDSFYATIVGVNKAGLFVGLADTGAQGFIPSRTLRGDIFYHDENNYRLVGRRTQQSYQLGDKVMVRLLLADITTSSLIFEIESHSGTLHKKPAIIKPAKKPPEKSGKQAARGEKTSLRQMKKIKKPKKF